jgi:hypothetical protein
VTLRVQEAAEMVRAAAGLHSDDASWQFCRQLDHAISLQASPQHNVPGAIQAHQTARLLTKIDTEHCDLHDLAPSLSKLNRAA